MSRAVVQHEVTKFLLRPDSQVLCMRGRWGVGKTHTWNECLENYSTHKNENEKYSYVSLFGINSLEILKTTIFENTVSVKYSQEGPSLETLNDLLSSIKALRKYFGIIGKIPFFKQANDALVPAVFMAVRNQIICLDDLERRGASLSINDVLGLVSFLKEKRNCKVILLLNEEQLGNQRNDFERYLEKVVDVSLTFAPSSQECALIALPAESELNEYLRDFSERLKITNIRVIQRIGRIAEGVQARFADRDRRVFREAVKALAVLGWSRLMPDDAPPMSFLKDHASLRFQILTNKVEIDPTKTNWHNLLEEIEFQNAFGLDEALGAGIQNGFFNVELVDGLIDKAEENLREVDLQREFSEAWDLFHDTLENNQEQFVEEVVEALRKAVHKVSPQNVDSTVTILKQLGNEELAQEIVALYAKAITPGNLDYFRRGHPFARVQDPDLKKALQQRLDQTVDDRTGVVVLTEVAQGNYSRENVEYLARLSKQALRDELRQIRGADLHNAIVGCLLFPEYTGDEREIVADKVRDVIADIAKESPINRIRMERYAAQTGGVALVEEIRTSEKVAP